MNTIAKLLAALALLAGPVIASAADAVTYNFTGVVTSGSFEPIGTAVTGTFTFIYNSADIITGTVGSSSSWEIQASGPFLPRVFSSVILVNGQVLYESAPLTFASSASIASGGGTTFYSAELARSYPESSYLYIAGGSPYNAAGYPVLSMGAIANGGYYAGWNSDSPIDFANPGNLTNGVFYLEYTVTSLTLTPASQLAVLLTEVTGVGPGRSLADKVTAAQAYYAANDVQATCAMLTGFVNEVRAQNGKKVGRTLDAQLIADADTLEVAIGCN
jgi:hypothetical protein